jgi:ABC-type methionine transport system permease subunit
MMREAIGMELTIVLVAFLIVVGLPLGLLLLTKAHRQYMDNLVVRAERAAAEKARREELKFHYENFP